MAANRNRVEITWKIKNFSSCRRWYIRGEALNSSSFSVVEEQWRISLYPNGSALSEKTGLFLKRLPSSNDSGTLIVDFEFALVTAEGTREKVRNANNIAFWNNADGNVHFTLPLYPANKKTLFLPDNALTVQLRMWVKNKQVPRREEIYTETHIDETCYLWEVPNFSEKDKVIAVKRIPVKETNKGVLKLSLFWDCSDEALIQKDQLRIMIFAASLNNNSSCFIKIQVRDNRGKVATEVEKKMSFPETAKNAEWVLALPISRQDVVNKNNNFLVNDMLVLGCEFVFLTQLPAISLTPVESESDSVQALVLSDRRSSLASVSSFQSNYSSRSNSLVSEDTLQSNASICSFQSYASIDTLLFEEPNDAVQPITLIEPVTSTALCETIKVQHIQSVDEGAADDCHLNLLRNGATTDRGTLKDCLKRLFLQNSFSDFVFSVDRQTFSAHSSILGCRSKKLRQLVSKRDGTISMSDLGAQTASRMLFFIYTDMMDELTLNEDRAAKLYEAARRYEIKPLERICRSYLKSHLSVSNIGSTLFLASKHKDGDLRFTSDLFFLEHESEIIDDKMWTNFTTKYPSLAVETMTTVSILRRMNSNEAREALLQKQLDNNDEFTTLEDDIRSLYNEKFLSDISIVVDTEVFPVHTAILGCRSPVFRKLLENDVSGKKDRRIDMIDLDPATARRMIHFMYTDEVGALDSDSAVKLYFAADKYELQLMIEECSKFLKENLSKSNVCSVLELADRHSDETLVYAVYGFIMENEYDVVSSKEWRELIKRNAKLVAETLTSITLNKLERWRNSEAQLVLV